MPSAAAVSEAHYRRQIPQLAGSPNGRRRAEVLGEFFRCGGFPTGADEEWRFSDLDALRRTEYRAYPPLSGPPRAEREEGVPAWTREFGHRVLSSEGRCFDLAAGRRSPELHFAALTLPGSEDGEAAEAAVLPPWFGPGWPGGGEAANGTGAALGASLRRSLDRHPLELLNAALAGGGFRVSVGAGVEEAEPILLYSKRRDTGDGHPRMLHPRSVIELAPGSRATVIEAHDGASETGGWTNPTTLCRVGADAELHFVRLELETGNLIHTSRTTFRLGRNARVFSTVLSLGEAQVRDDQAAVLTDPGAEADFAGLFLGRGISKADQHTLAVHVARNSASRQLFKNVLTDRARAVFDGRVVVAPGAIGTDARQTNRNLLLSDAARVHTKPRLEINADDVRCAHGAAIGRLDEEALFYLRSRGLGRMDSRQLLLRAFAGEVVERVPVPAVRELAEAGLSRLREDRSAATGALSP